MGEDKDVKKIQGKASLVLATVSDTLRALVFRYLKSIRTGSSDLDQLHYSSVRVFFLFRVTNIKLEKTRIIPELCAIGNLYFCNTDYKYFVFHLFRLNDTSFIMKVNMATFCTLLIITMLLLSSSSDAMSMGGLMGGGGGNAVSEILVAGIIAKLLSEHHKSGGCHS
ncbi:hypothetical protein NPIL_80052 [Nephila pilipes]|uniref:Uncharacterized protein n=1 Tax=Nephila pilipes TaxID=299642 RepID=A0A8X6UC88_NEPPI|nr:hypothetical protein NPIL_80052 [Nephila pilipes]